MGYNITRDKMKNLLTYTDIDGFNNDIFDLMMYTPSFVETHRTMTFHDVYLVYKLAVRVYKEVKITVDIVHKSEIYMYCE